MKKRIWPKLLAISLVLLLSVFVVSGCNELKELKSVLVESAGAKSLGAYENKVLIMFIYESDKNFWFNVFNFETSEYINFGIEEPEENRMGIKYYCYRSNFYPSTFDNEQGLGVQYPPWGGETKYMSKKDYWEEVKPIIAKILEQKKPILDAMREAAIDAGLLEKPQSI